MKFISIDSDGKVSNQEPHFATGTSLQGYIEVSYKKLVNTFGEPNQKGDGYKVDADWLVFTIDGIATIYNYKNGKNYLGKEGLEVKNIKEWHIGGNNKRVIEWIKKALT